MQIVLKSVIACHTVKLKCKYLDVRFSMKANLVGEAPDMVGNLKNKGNLVGCYFSHYFRE